MAAQSERESGVVVMCSVEDDPMAQDNSPEQDIDMGELELPPQMDPEPEMGAAAAAKYDTSPPLLRNPPPILAESAQPSMFDMILQAINGIKENGWHGTNNAGGDAVHGCRPTEGTRGIKDREWGTATGDVLGE